MKYRSCAALIAVSSQVAEKCKEIAPHRKIEVVHDAVTFKGRDYSREEARARLNLPSELTVIASVAHFTKEKNLPLIIQTARSLSVRYPQVKFALVGPSELKQIPETIPQNCIFTGMIEEAYKYYGAFDGYISASTLEGLGSALIDAVVRDIPVVALDAGGTQDIPMRKEALIPWGRAEHFSTALERMLENLAEWRNDAKHYGAKAREKFGIDNYISRHLRLYEETMDR